MFNVNFRGVVLKLSNNKREQVETSADYNTFYCIPIKLTSGQ